MDKGGIIVGKGHVLGVRVKAVSAEALELAYVHVQRKRDGVHLRAQGTAASPKELVAALGTRFPVTLVFDTDRCVHRVLDRTGEADALLSEAFPNAPLDELITSLWGQHGATGASMARRQAVMDVIERFTVAGLRVIGLHIGPWGLLGLHTLTGGTANDWTCGGYRFTLEEGRPRQLTRAPGTEAELTIGTEVIGADQALAFASAYEHLVQAPERIDPARPELQVAQQQERSRRLYETGLVAALLLFVLLVAGERTLAYRLQRSAAALRTTASAHARAAEELGGLKQRVEAMERAGALLGEGRSDRLALQAARIAASVPADIRLERLAEHPLRAPVRERTALEIATGVVDVRGACSDAHVLDAWVGTLRTLPGIREVKLITYTVDPEDGRPRFQLELIAT